ncbi:MAG TPA: hypothetical protein VGQ72_02840 [Pyrinomonadaceae bacterium]|nr:hypothetical protein [Pyrinomonadaceae bacterium]
MQKSTWVAYSKLSHTPGTHGVGVGVGDGGGGEGAGGGVGA